MIAVCVSIEIDPDRTADFIPIAREIAEASLTEAACHRFDISQDLDRPNKFVFYEVYDDEAAFAEHKTTPHAARFKEQTEGFFLNKSGQRCEIL